MISLAVPNKMNICQLDETNNTKKTDDEINAID